jgi:sec-independent protein translocase protein TatB
MLSPSHLIIVFLVALLVFGPEKLPELARTLSKAMGEFHRLTGDFQETLQRGMRQLEQETNRQEPPKADEFQSETASSEPDTVSGALPEGDFRIGEVPPESGESVATPENSPETGPAAAAASTFEGFRYDDASYVASVAKPSDEKWAGKSSGAAKPEGSPGSEPAAGTPPDHDASPEAGNSPAEDKPALAGGAEKPVNDHPTAA